MKPSHSRTDRGASEIGFVVTVGGAATEMVRSEGGAGGGASIILVVVTAVGFVSQRSRCEGKWTHIALQSILCSWQTLHQYFPGQGLSRSKLFFRPTKVSNEILKRDNQGPPPRRMDILVQKELWCGLNAWASWSFLGEDMAFQQLFPPRRCVLRNALPEEVRLQ